MLDRITVSSRPADKQITFLIGQTDPQITSL